MQDNKKIEYSILFRFTLGLVGRKNASQFIDSITRHHTRHFPADLIRFMAAALNNKAQQFIVINGNASPA